MRLIHTLKKNGEELVIEVEYDKKERTVTEVVEVSVIGWREQIDITKVLGEWFNLDEVIDKIDWAEKAAS
jgi:hypothetical protein